MPRNPEKLTHDLSPQGVSSWLPLLLLFFSLYLLYLILSPFIDTIILAMVLAAMAAPLYHRLEPRFGGRRNLAGLVTVLFVVVCILLPVMLFLTGLVSQGVQTAGRVTVWVKETDVIGLLKEKELHPYLVWLDEQLPFIGLEKVDYQAFAVNVSQAVGQFLLRLGTNFLGNLAWVLFHFLIMCVALFYLVRDGRWMIARLMFLLPMRADQTGAIITSLRQISRAVLLGGLLVALAQGVIGGIGLALVGIPGFFWGTMMGFTSLVPVLGTSLVWVPATAYLLFTGQWGSAIFLAAWCVLLVTNIDTFLRPYLMRDAAGVSIFYIFLAVFGGIKFFGPIGLIYGPLIMTLVMAMLKIYTADYRDALAPQALDEAEIASRAKEEADKEDADKEDGGSVT